MKVDNQGQEVVSIEKVKLAARRWALGMSHNSSSLTDREKRLASMCVSQAHEQLGFKGAYFANMPEEQRKDWFRRISEALEKAFTLWQIANRRNDNKQ